MNPHVHGNCKTSNLELTTFSITKQGAIKTTGTHERKFEQLRHGARAGVRETEFLYNIRKSNDLLNLASKLDPFKNCSWEKVTLTGMLTY